jgi:hypothetical protein
MAIFRPRRRLLDFDSEYEDDDEEDLIAAAQFDVRWSMFDLNARSARAFGRV